ncbi:MAG: phage tail tube protein [Aestuariivirga sp.]
MPSAAISGYGTLLKRGDGGSPETFSTVGEVRSISGPSIETDEIDVTTHSSAAAGAFKEFIMGLIDAGSVEFDINYVPSDPTHIGLRNDLLNRTKRNWQIVLPGAIQTISFAGYVKSAPFEFPTDDAIMQKISIRCTGAPTFS